ncbi:hypothetical protein Y032_0023g722 [Ancylostoma ceylanicum]|uniref:Uncharacterized protein n=1 Tax=Ancylostoma ceylanicum TaxID=53326 RepID=A0A016UWH8_9BILA|nr:hypothetical protein Y032_0023g722 [Ancylostoma ceylanicum]
MLLSEAFHQENCEFTRCSSRGSSEPRRKHERTSPLPHNFVDSVYSVRNPSLQTARSGSDTQRKFLQEEGRA